MPFHAHRSGSDGEPKHFLPCLTLLWMRDGVAESSDRGRHGQRFALPPRAEACCIAMPAAIAGGALPPSRPRGSNSKACSGRPGDAQLIGASPAIAQRGNLLSATGFEGIQDNPRAAEPAAVAAAPTPLPAQNDAFGIEVLAP